MKILLLCNKSPYPPAEGGPIAMNAVIEGLIRAGHQVKVIAINSNKYFVDPADIPPDYLGKTGMEMVYVDLSVKPLRALVNLFSKKSYHVERFITPNFEKKLREVLTGETFDIIQFELLYLSPYLNIIRKLSDARIVLRAHNIEHLIWERIKNNCKNPVKRFYLNHLYKTLKHFELASIQRFDAIAAITGRDADYFKSHTKNIPVIDLPFGVYPHRYPSKKTEPEFPSLFHIGSMNWMPNEEGIRWFLDKVWPAAYKRFPGVTLYLAGRNMPWWLQHSSFPHVEIIGEVEDALEFMRSKAIMIVPLFSGSGIRIKIIEAMLAERPVISTSIGAEGINFTAGKDILIADTPEEFLDAIRLCIENKTYCEEIGSNARKLIEKEHDNDRLIKRLTLLYEQIINNGS